MPDCILAVNTCSYVDSTVARKKSIATPMSCRDMYHLINIERGAAQPFTGRGLAYFLTAKGSLGLGEAPWISITRENVPVPPRFEL